jgi:hypothetical protein
MPTQEEMQAAVDRMEAAKNALREYVERSTDADANPALHRKLTDDLRLAMNDFLRVMGSSS